MTSPNGGGGGGGGATSTGPNPFAPVIDACAQTRNSFDPHNAKTVEAWHAGLSDFVDGVVQMFQGHGDKLANEFHLDPASATYAQGLSGVFARFQGPVEAAHSTFRNVHAEDLERINNPKPNQDKWDISRNQG